MKSTNAPLRSIGYAFLRLGIIFDVSLLSCGTPITAPTQTLVEPSPTTSLQSVPPRANATAEPSPTIGPLPSSKTGVIAPWSASPLQTSLDNGARVDLDKIFPPGDGRILITTRCTVCHRYGILVRGQRTLARWEAIRWSHRGKTGLDDDADLKTMFDYLEANFNPSNPEPDLPPWFLLEEDSPEW